MTGVRKSGTDVRATVDDQWHLGSDTKAMTAALIGLLVERGRLRWDTTIEDVFPDLASASSSPLKKATVQQLLSHFSGTPGDFPDLQPILRERGVRRRREAVVRLALTRRDITVGDEIGVLQFGYVIAGAMAERIENTLWEELMTRFVFRPLVMTRVGFGGTGKRGRMDHPGRTTRVASPWATVPRSTILPTSGRPARCTARSATGRSSSRISCGVHAARVGCFARRRTGGFTRRRSAACPRSAGVRASGTA